MSVFLYRIHVNVSEFQKYLPDSQAFYLTNLGKLQVHPLFPYRQHIGGWCAIVFNMVFNAWVFE